MSQNQPNKQVYRVSLPASTISYLNTLAKNAYAAASTNAEQMQALDAISKLATYIAKIDAGAITSAYTLAPPKPSLAESLGFTDPNSPQKDLLIIQTKEEFWKECYSLYVAANCNWSELTVEQIAGAKEYMYLHDLMSAEELEAFEAIGETL